MPSVCSTPGCTNLVRRGRCSQCALEVEQVRGSSTRRGYGGDWRDFRRRFMSMLIEAGIAPICGAVLPGGPVDQTPCEANGLATYRSADGSDLHLDHTPPLQDWERVIVAKVCDPMRIKIRCRECHSRKTAEENSSGNLENGKTISGPQVRRSFLSAGLRRPISLLAKALRWPRGGVSFLPNRPSETTRATEKAGCAHRGEKSGARFGVLDFAFGVADPARKRANA
jgi:hypothetical protein